MAKSFKNSLALKESPALQFMSEESLGRMDEYNNIEAMQEDVPVRETLIQATEEKEATTPKKTFKKSPKTADSRLKDCKVSLLLPSDDLKKIKVIAHIKQDSVNNVIAKMISEYIQKNKSMLEKFEEIFQS